MLARDIKSGKDGQGGGEREPGMARELCKDILGGES